MGAADTSQTANKSRQDERKGERERKQKRESGTETERQKQKWCLGKESEVGEGRTMLLLKWKQREMEKREPLTFTQ